MNKTVENKIRTLRKEKGVIQIMRLLSTNYLKN